MSDHSCRHQGSSSIGLRAANGTTACSGPRDALPLMPDACAGHGASLHGCSENFLLIPAAALQTAVSTYNQSRFGCLASWSRGG